MTVNPFNSRVADYGPLGYDRTHVLVFNYVYNPPKFIKSQSAAGKVGGAIANNWQVSGITSFMTGAPTTPGFSISGIGNLNERYTGSPDVGPRIVMNSSPSYPKGDLPVDEPGGSGPAGGQRKRGLRFRAATPSVSPGDNDWDISIFKNFPVWRETHVAAIARGDVQRVQPCAVQRFQYAARNSIQPDNWSTLRRCWAEPADASDSARSPARPIRAESSSRRSSTSEASNGRGRFVSPAPPYTDWGCFARFFWCSGWPLSRRICWTAAGRL